MLYIHCTACFSPFYPVAGSDYDAVLRALLQFPRGRMRVCHRVTIRQDSDCELPPRARLEYFFSDLSHESGVGEINIVNETAQVFISDVGEPECGMLV